LFVAVQDGIGWRNSDRLSGAAPFIDVDVISDGLDIIAIGETGIGLPLREDLGDVIVPSQLRRVIIPHPLVGRVERTSVFLAPGEDLLVTPAFEDPSPERFIPDVEKLHTGRIGADPEIGVEVLPKTTGGMEPDLPDHAGKIHEARGLLERAAGQ